MTITSLSAFVTSNEPERVVLPLPEGWTDGGGVWHGPNKSEVHWFNHRIGGVCWSHEVEPTGIVYKPRWDAGMLSGDWPTPELEEVFAAFPKGLRAGQIGEIPYGDGMSMLPHRALLETVVVTRHPALVEYLDERGVIDADARVISHAAPDDVRGKRVVGVLPIHLAALAAQVVTVPLSLPPEARGRELTLEEVREFAGKPRTFTVEEVAY